VALTPARASFYCRGSRRATVEVARWLNQPRRSCSPVGGGVRSWGALVAGASFGRPSTSAPNLAKLSIRVPLDPKNLRGDDVLRDRDDVLVGAGGGGDRRVTAKPYLPCRRAHGCGERGKYPFNARWSAQRGGADATVNSRSYCLILVGRFRPPCVSSSLSFWLVRSEAGILVSTGMPPLAAGGSPASLGLRSKQECIPSRFSSKDRTSPSGFSPTLTPRATGGYDSMKLAPGG
jgi:hypothetical protein